jgi:hypothetical protein
VKVNKLQRNVRLKKEACWQREKYSLTLSSNTFSFRPLSETVMSKNEKRIPASDNRPDPLQIHILMPAVRLKNGRACRPNPNQLQTELILKQKDRTVL